MGRKGSKKRKLERIGTARPGGGFARKGHEGTK